MRGALTTSLMGGLSIAVLLLGLAQSAMSRADKVDICHIDQDTGIGKILSVSVHALPAHIAHGDNEYSEVEICDNMDNDCDGEVDEDIPAAACTDSYGACEELTGSLICNSGILECQVNPPEENETICWDAEDNDCDGVADADDPDCEPCTAWQDCVSGCTDGIEYSTTDIGYDLTCGGAVCSLPVYRPDGPCTVDWAANYTWSSYVFTTTSITSGYELNIDGLNHDGWTVDGCCVDEWCEQPAGLECAPPGPP